MAERKSLSVQLTPRAEDDLWNIWQWSLSRYGLEHADAYRSFVELEIGRLADFPELGEAVSHFSEVRRLLIKRVSAQFGHFAFYRLKDGQIEVIRILHTAQDWQGRNLGFEE
jgi:toxin ParE1/3/4